MTSRLEQAPDTVNSRVVISIWQEVFARPSVQDNDNFFALGGNATSAHEIFRRLSAQFERELHPALILRAPTPAAQTLMLHDSHRPRIPAVIPLKAGTGFPVFLLHGIGGSVLEFLELVKYIETPLPIYGLQAEGTDGIRKPLASIEAMVTSFLIEVQKQQPRGPYILMGHSLGGLVALEMARQLSERGQEIGLLSMIDAYPDRSQLSAYQKARLVLRLLRKHATKSSLRFAMQRVSQSAGGSRASSAAQLLLDASFQALRDYRPRDYNGPVRFVTASVATDFPDNPEAVWRKVLHNLRIETVTGDHHEILSAHARDLGALQTRYLKEALENYIA